MFVIGIAFSLRVFEFCFFCLVLLLLAILDGLPSGLIVFFCGSLSGVAALFVSSPLWA